MKYKEAYSTTYKKDMDIDIVRTVYVQDREKFVCRFDGKLFCPGCRCVRLAFIDAISPHFRGYPNDEHQTDCPYQKEEMTSIEAMDIAANTKNAEWVKKQMERLITVQMREAQQSAVENPITPKSVVGIMEGQSKKTNTYFTKRLPQKEITNPLRAQDIDAVKMFYGTVFLNWEVQKKRKLLVWNPNTRRLICRIMVSDNVWNNLADEYRSIVPGQYHFVYTGKISWPQKDKSTKSSNWFEGILWHSSYLRIER